MVREFRRDAAVRLLTILAVVTLVLSLGPYVPGFRHLIGLPGFSFFRAPRAGAWRRPWRWRSWPGRDSTDGRSGRGPGARFAVRRLAIVWAVVVLGLIDWRAASS